MVDDCGAFAAAANRVTFEVTTAGSAIRKVVAGAGWWYAAAAGVAEG